MTSNLLHIPSFAKINLFLRVIRRRPDGYHNLLSLMCCVELADYLELDFATTRLHISTTHPEVPANQHNTVWRAARLFFDITRRPAALRIHIHKNIPVAAGLGGGSSNAAAILTTLNQRYGHPLAHRELMALGRQIGADVPFFIGGHPAWAAGIGERLREVCNLPVWNVLLVNPGFAVSTAATYKNLNLRLTKCKQKLKYHPLRLPPTSLPALLCNDLETVTIPRYTAIAEIKSALIQHGAAGALMSGSGPTVFGLFETDQTARRAFAALVQNKSWQVFLTRLRTGR